MERRELGTTGLVVSRLGLGLAALGRPGYINLDHAEDLHHQYDVVAMRAHAHAVLDAAWAAGIRYFDAARSYGRAEEFLGTWLSSRQIAPGTVVVGSKWGYTYTAGWQVDAPAHEVKEHSVGVLKRQIAESRAALGEHLTLYQIHSATLDSGVLDNHEVLEELSRLRADGLRIGLTLSGPRQAETLRCALRVRVGGRPLFDTVQATWNLLEPSAGAALRAARDTGMGVIIKEAVANGRLTSRNHEAAFARSRHALDAVAAQLRTSLDGLALAAVLAQPWVDVVLSGAATVTQLRSNVGGTQVSWDPALMTALSAVVEAPESYWTTRGQLPWN